MPKKYKIKGTPAFASASYPIVLEVDSLALSHKDFQAFVEEACVDIAQVMLSNKRAKQHNVEVRQVRISHGKSPSIRSAIAGD